MNEKITGTPAEAGRPVVSVYADGQVTGLSVHVREGTALGTSDYPAEGRTVLHIGETMPTFGGVSVFVPSVPALAALIDTLNTAYVRLSSVERLSPTPCAPSEPAGARPRPSRRQPPQAA
jgi:hypothetical protein